MSSVLQSDSSDRKEFKIDKGEEGDSLVEEKYNAIGTGDTIKGSCDVIGAGDVIEASRNVIEAGDKIEESTNVIEA